VVFQDVRGCGDSEGSFVPFSTEGDDGFDTVEWLAGQAWCDGRVGMYGFSYPGAAQLLAAAAHPPHLAAVAPAMTASDYRRRWVYESGALRLGFILWWACELAKDAAVRAGDVEALYELWALQRDPADMYWRYSMAETVPEVLSRHAPYLADWLRHREDEGYWHRLAAADGLREADVVGLHLAGWYDTFLEGTLETYRLMAAAARAPQYLIVGPWQHIPWGRRAGERDFGGEAASAVDEIQLRFFDAALKGREQPMAEYESAPVRIFAMGSDRWLTLGAWPPEAAQTERFLTSEGRANSESGDGRLAEASGERPMVDRYVVDPWNPVRSSGGWGCCDPLAGLMGPSDRSQEQQRPDLLVFDSDELTRDLVVVGTPVLTIEFSCDLPTTDLVVRLVDVHPDARAYSVSEGFVRIPEPSRNRLVEVRLSPVAVALREGHVMRLEISGNDYPARELNLQVPPSQSEASLADAMAGTHVIHHGGTSGSRLTLPLLDA